MSFVAALYQSWWSNSASFTFQPEATNSLYLEVIPNHISNSPEKKNSDYPPHENKTCLPFTCIYLQQHVAIYFPLQRQLCDCLLLSLEASWLQTIHANNSCVALDLGIFKPWAWSPKKSEKRRQPCGVVVKKKRLEATAVSLTRLGCLHVCFDRELPFDYLPSVIGAWHDFFFETPAMVGTVCLLLISGGILIATSTSRLEKVF